MAEEESWPPRSLTRALSGRCPHCGEGRMFKGFIGLQDVCSSCGLDFTKVDPGDGPAVFSMFIVGTLIVGGALWLEVAVTPPMWVHMSIWLPLTAILGIGLIRPLKAWLIASEYYNHAAEGRLDE